MSTTNKDNAMLVSYAPQELADKVKQAAKQNRRSISAEIVVRLEKSFTPNKDSV